MTLLTVPQTLIGAVKSLMKEDESFLISQAKESCIDNSVRWSSSFRPSPRNQVTDALRSPLFLR